MTRWLLPTLLAFLLAGCKTISVESHWTKEPFIIDGDDTEWKSSALRLEKQGVFLSIRNDENYLYVGLAPTSQPLQTEMIRNGLTVWFDPEGKKHKTFGVRYPIGFEGSPLLDPNSGAFKKGRETSLAELDLLGPGKFDVYRVSADHPPDVTARIDHHNGRLIYEIKVPFNKSSGSGYGISDKPVRTLLIGFDIPDRDFGPAGRPGAGGGGSGMSGGGGQRGGGRPGGIPAGESEPVSLNLWIEVTVASPSADSSAAF